MCLLEKTNFKQKQPCAQFFFFHLPSLCHCGLTGDAKDEILACKAMSGQSKIQLKKWYGHFTAHRPPAKPRSHPWRTVSKSVKYKVSLWFFMIQTKRHFVQEWYSTTKFVVLMTYFGPQSPKRKTEKLVYWMDYMRILLWPSLGCGGGVHSWEDRHFKNLKIKRSFYISFSGKHSNT